jgi:hypothetical protein
MANKRWEADTILGISIQTIKWVWRDKFTHIERDKNWFVNALATLASVAKIDRGNIV